jgi:hypothetical protein
MNLHLPTRTIRLLSAALAAVAVTACSAAGDTAAEAEEPATTSVEVEPARPGFTYDCQRLRSGSYC